MDTSTVVGSVSQLRGFEKLTKEAHQPTKGTKYSAGNDFYLKEDVKIFPGELKLICTGITAYMQPDEYLDLRIRSSLAKRELILVNGCGVIDSDYYGKDIGFLVYNLSSDPINLKAGDRIGQGIFTKYYDADNVEILQDERTGGYGSTGK